MVSSNTTFSVGRRPSGGTDPACKRSPPETARSARNVGRLNCGGCGGSPFDAATGRNVWKPTHARMGRYHGWGARASKKGPYTRRRDRSRPTGGSMFTQQTTARCPSTPTRERTPLDPSQRATDSPRAATVWFTFSSGECIFRALGRIRRATLGKFPTPDSTWASPAPLGTPRFLGTHLNIHSTGQTQVHRGACLRVKARRTVRRFKSGTPSGRRTDNAFTMSVGGKPPAPECGRNRRGSPNSPRCHYALTSTEATPWLEPGTATFGLRTQTDRERSPRSYVDIIGFDFSKTNKLPPLNR